MTSTYLSPGHLVPGCFHLFPDLGAVCITTTQNLYARPLSLRFLVMYLWQGFIVFVQDIWLWTLFSWFINVTSLWMSGYSNICMAGSCVFHLRLRSLCLVSHFNLFPYLVSLWPSSSCINFHFCWIMAIHHFPTTTVMYKPQAFKLFIYVWLENDIIRASYAPDCLCLSMSVW